MLSREELEQLSTEELRVLFGRVSSVLQKRRKVRKGYNYLPNSASAKISALAIGESRLFPEWTAAACLGTWIRRYARQRMNAPEAQWKANVTNHGVRVTRIA